MTTHLVHAPLDMSALCRWARARGLTGRVPFDAGYALHVLLSAMFGKGALQPFRMFGSERRRDGALYAYAEKDSTALRQVAAAAATRRTATACCCYGRRGPDRPPQGRG